MMASMQIHHASRRELYRCYVPRVATRAPQSHVSTPIVPFKTGASNSIPVWLPRAKALVDQGHQCRQTRSISSRMLVTCASVSQDSPFDIDDASLAQTERTRESLATDRPFSLSCFQEPMGFDDGKGALGGKGESALPTQGDAIVQGTGTVVAERSSPGPTMDLMQELLAIQQSGPKCIGFFGTRNMGFLHQQLIEILSYAMVLTGNHIFTSGATGTNAAVIRGALRAERPELLTVVLPQSLSRQPKESRELLSEVANIIETPENDSMALIDASRLCNEQIVQKVQQVICFAFHDSNLLLETCREAKHLRKMVTLFYLD